MARPIDEGPTTAARAERQDTGDAAQIAEEQLARSTAMREQAVDAGRGAGPTRPDPKDPKSRLDAQAAASRADPGIVAAFTRHFADLTEGAMGDGAFDAEEAVEEQVDEEREADRERARRPAPRAPRGPDFGGEADPAPAAPPDADPEVDPPGKGPAKWPRVSAKHRIRMLDLPELLDLGATAGVLVGWQGKTVEPRVLDLPARWFHSLHETLEALPSRVARTVVLKGLAAHRHPQDLERLRLPLGLWTDDDARAWVAGLEEERPSDERSEGGPAPALETLRRHYDPLASLLDEPSLPPPDALEPWGVPKWLRGAPREALELCAVGFHQAACDHLHPELETKEGAGDPLMAALEIHHPSHPSIARWTTTLVARASDGPGLWAAAEALRAARGSY